MSHPILKNLPNGYINYVDWKFLDRETYEEIEGVLIDGVKLFDPFLVDDFYPEDMFQELVEICNSYDLKKLDYSRQMNKWEEGIDIPQKFIDYAVEKVKSLLDIDDVMFGYHMYAHHQITSDNLIPKLPLHIDWAPGAYMVDLHIGGNRDWGFVARYENFITKPNQAIICQPQIDFHYRPPWGNDDPDEYYQALFFHLVNKNSWIFPNGTAHSDRSPELESKYNFGPGFRETDVFKNFQEQRAHIFQNTYIKKVNSLIGQGQLPPIPWEHRPTEEEATVHDKKGVTPKKESL